MDKEQLKSLLHTGIVCIRHRNKAGELRERRATLMPVFMPEAQTPVFVRPSPDHIVRVFDVDIDQWRTIIVANVETAAMATVEP
jgi:hypothetical protein